MLGSVAHYNLLERIGEGVLGDVYRARDTKVGRTVALKLQREPQPAGRRHERLVDDARAAAKISHPNIATLFDVGYHEGRLYLAYEFVQGTTLRQQMEGRPMNPRHALDLAAQVADALAHAHAHGVVHKDLSPDTIIETAKGSAKVLDFGMSAWTRGGQTRALAAAAPRQRRRGGDRHAVLRLAGTGARRRRRSPNRPVLARRDRLRDAHRPESVRRPRRVDDPDQHDRSGAAGAELASIPTCPSCSTSSCCARSPAIRRAGPRARRSWPRTSGAAPDWSTRWPRNVRHAEPRRPAGDDPDLIPLEEDKGGIWWLFVGLGGALAAALYFWLR